MLLILHCVITVTFPREPETSRVEFLRKNKARKANKTLIFPVRFFVRFSLFFFKAQISFLSLFSSVNNSVRRAYSWKALVISPLHNDGQVLSYVTCICTWVSPPPCFESWNQQKKRGGALTSIESCFLIGRALFSRRASKTGRPTNCVQPMLFRLCLNDGCVHSAVSKL